MAGEEERKDELKEKSEAPLRPLDALSVEREVSEADLEKVVESPPPPAWLEKLVMGDFRKTIGVALLLLFLLFLLKYAYTDEYTGLLGRLLLLLTVFALVVALQQRHITLATLGIIGALVTPFLQHNPGVSAIPYLAYLLLLVLNILILIDQYHWKGLDYFTFLASIGYYLYLVNFSGTEIKTGGFFLFLSAYFLVFGVQFTVESVVRAKTSKISDLAFLAFNAIFYFIGTYLLLHKEFFQVLGLFSAALTVLFLSMFLLLRERENRDYKLIQVLLGGGLLFLTVTLGLKVPAGWTSIAWALEAALLIVAGFIARNKVAYSLGVLALLLVFFRVTFLDFRLFQPESSLAPLKFLNYLISGLAIAVALYFHYLYLPESHKIQKRIYTGLIFLAGFFGLYWGTYEILNFSALKNTWIQDFNYLAQLRMYQQLGLSLFWIIYCLVIAGFLIWKKYRGLSLLPLIFCAVIFLKLWFFDLGHLQWYFSMAGFFISLVTLSLLLKDLYHLPLEE